MKTNWQGKLLFSLFCLSLIGGIQVDAASPAIVLKVGVAAVDITPEGKGVMDRLEAKAMVFQQNGIQAALVVCDVIGISGIQSKQARALVSETTGIPISNISLVATHSHSGGYHKDFVQKIAEVVVSSQAALQTVSLKTGTAQQLGISFNRRFLMKDGTVRFNPGYGPDKPSFDGGNYYQNPNIVRPVGPIDPGVGILVFYDGATNEPWASLTNFANHACTCPGEKFSADYPGVLARNLREGLGKGFFSLFGSGPCGDVNHIDPSKPAPQSTQQEYYFENYTKPVGNALAATIQAKLPNLKQSNPALAVASETLQVPLAPFSDMDLAWAKEATANGFKDFPGTSYDQLGFLAGIRAMRILALEEFHKKGDTMPLDIHVFRFSEDTALVTLPGEVFVELGLDIKKASPFANTLVMELANESKCQYIPTLKAFSEGGYEVVNSRLVPNGGDLLVQAAIKMLEHLKSQ